MNYKQLYKGETHGTFTRGIEINVATPTPFGEGVRKAAYEAADLLEQAMTREFYASNKEAQERTREQRRNLLACFTEAPVYVKPIPNGYCSKACCEHLPWYEVVTSIGVIKIGWRKRVIVVDWSETDVTTTAEELFPGEDVTKYGQLIHAWGYEDARGYLTVLFKSAEESQ